MERGQLDPLQWLEQNLPPGPPVFVFDKFVRFGPKKSCWYIAREVIGTLGRPNVIFIHAGNFKEGIEGSAYFCERRLKADELIKHEAELKREVSLELEKLQQEAAAKASKLQENGNQNPQPSTYWERKQITITDPGVIQCGDARLIPCRDIDGVLWGHQKILSSGAKFFSAGQKTKGTFHLIGHAPTDDETPILLCEGYATGASIRAATSLPVVVCYNAANLPTVALAIRKKCPTNPLIICGDDDHASPQNVGKKYAEEAASAVTGYTVYPTFSALDGKNTTDFNDLHCLEGLKAVERQVLNVVNQAKPLAENECLAPIFKGDPERDESESPNRLAEKYIKDNILVTDVDENTFQYTGYHWRHLTESQMRRHVMEYDVAKFTSQARRKESVSYAKAVTLRDTPIPWRSIKDDEIPLKNCVYSVNTGESRPHAASDYLETVLPIELDLGAECPRWLNALALWFEGDDDAFQKIETLQLFMGYILMPHARYKKALLCYGPSNTGKSVVAHVMKELVGFQNVCSIAIEDMGDPKKRSSIKGKMLNIVTELSHNALIHDAGFKQLVSTEDPITIEAKFKNPEAYIPFCKHVLCTNSLPTINDQSDATYNRLLLVEFNRILAKEEQDEGIFAALRAELPGILNWALEGAIKLYSLKGRFPEIASAQETMAEHRRESNPVFAFAESRLEQTSDESIETPLELVYAAFRDHTQGTKIPIHVFGKLLNQIGFKVHRGRRDGTRTRFYKGLRIIPKSTSLMGGY